jgi:hypothetical protein
MKKLLVLVVMLVLAASVSASFGDKCDGNTLLSHDLSNNPVKRDCSILHAGSGAVFRGVCKSYDGGADCFRAEGDVTAAYRDAVRASSNYSGWFSSFNFSETTTSIPTVTTTLVQCPVCPICSACENCTPYKNEVDYMNVSCALYQRNSQSCGEKIKYMYSSEDYKALQAADKKATDDLTASLATCNTDKKNVMNTSSTYLWMAIFAILILFVVVVAWLRFEWIGDPKMKDLFKVEKKAS